MIGAGAWGTALALVAQRAGRPVTLWAREPEVVAAITTSRENTPFLPGVHLPAALDVRGGLAEAITGAEALLVAVPAQHVRATLQALAPLTVPLVLCAKGIEAETGLLMTEVAASVAPDAPLAVLSGPSFAADVGRWLPTAVTLAAEDLVLADRLVATLGGPGFRPYASDDPIGAEAGGAVKNVLAIACGIVEGKGFGASARAALIARGFAELSRFARALGARPETLGGLSGLGDLILTCTSVQSRNFAAGLALGQGQTLADALAGKRSVAEGVATAAPLVQRAAALGVEMPIAAAVDAILAGRLSVDGAIEALLARPFRREG